MDQNVATELLCSEIFNIKDYFQRVFSTSQQYCPEDKVIDEIIREFVNTDLCEIQEGLHFRAKSELAFDKVIFLLLDYLKAKLNIEHLNRIITDEYIEILNKILKFSFELHHQIAQKNDLIIQLPRHNMIKNSHHNPLGPLEICSLTFYNSLNSRVLSLGNARTNRYEDFLNKGRQLILKKDYENALLCFKQASQLHETAEAITLIGWAYSYLNDIEKAKSYCRKAIKIDPDYGNPYNDLGSYLYSQERFKEAIKWFELAKHTKYYTNREFPYINLGKVYLSQNKFTKALREFKKALELVPNNKNIASTIKTIEGHINKDLSH